MSVKSWFLQAVHTLTLAIFYSFKITDKQLIHDHSLFVVKLNGSSCM